MQAPDQVHRGSGEGSEGSGEGLGGLEPSPETFSGTLLNLTWLCISGTFSGTLLNLTCLRTKDLLRNLVEPDPEALVQSRSGSTGVRRRLQEVLVQSQVRLNCVPEKVPEKVPE